MSEAHPQSTPKDPDWETLEVPERVALFKMKDHLERLLPQLKEDIDAGRIGSVIGIDASGRIPALALADAIKMLQEKRGHRGLERRFLRGKLAFDTTALARLPGAIRKMRLPKDRKVLVVDDTYFTGGSVRPVVQELTAQGYRPQVVIMESLQPEEMRQAHPTALYSTDTGNAMLFKLPSVAGVHKWEHGPDTHATPLRSEPFYSTTGSNLKKIGAARRVMKTLIERTVQEFEDKKTA